MAAHNATFAQDRNTITTDKYMHTSDPTQEEEDVFLTKILPRIPESIYISFHVHDVDQRTRLGNNRFYTTDSCIGPYMISGVGELCIFIFLEFLFFIFRILIF